MSTHERKSTSLQCAEDSGDQSEVESTVRCNAQPTGQQAGEVAKKPISLETRDGAPSHKSTWRRQMSHLCRVTFLPKWNLFELAYKEPNLSEPDGMLAMCQIPVSVRQDLLQFWRRRQCNKLPNPPPQRKFRNWICLTKDGHLCVRGIFNRDLSQSIAHMGRVI